MNIAPNYRLLISCFLFVSALFIGFAVSKNAHALDTVAKQAIIIDMQTNAVLFEKDADTPMPPSSMSKMMTIYMLFSKLSEGSLSLDDKFKVSEEAWRKGGSKMWVKVGSRVRIEDLIRGIIVQSGNDACIVVAEGIAGDELTFAKMLTKKAAEIGMTKSNFVNASGWPDPNHLTTARDLATLAKRTILDFPQYFHFYSETEFTYSGISQGNRNPLLYKDLGADGLKTGHTEAGGYGLTGTAKQGDRRLLMVLNGMDSKKQRSSESERLMNWAFREFGNYALFAKGEEVTTAPVWLGENGFVPLVIGEDLVMTLPKKSRRKMKVSVRFNGPIPAPIQKGQQLATLSIEAPGIDTRELPLVAGQDIPQLGLFGRLGAAFSYIVWGASS